MADTAREIIHRSVCPVSSILRTIIVYYILSSVVGVWILINNGYLNSIYSFSLLILSVTSFFTESLPVSLSTFLTFMSDFLSLSTFLSFFLTLFFLLTLSRTASVSSSMVASCCFAKASWESVLAWDKDLLANIMAPTPNMRAWPEIIIMGEWSISYSPSQHVPTKYKG